MTDNERMQETMNQIDLGDGPTLVVNQKEDLEKDIIALEQNIKAAQEMAERLESEAPTHAPITPEQANLARRNIVFMKKDLENLKSRYKVD